MTLSTRKAIQRFIIVVIGLMVFLYCVFPLFWLIVSSVKPGDELFDLPISYIAKKPTLEFYKALFIPGTREAEGLPFVYYIRNSFVVAFSSVVLVVILSVFAGYGFSRFHFKGSRALLLSLMVTRMLPGPALMLPIYMMINRMGLIDNLFSLVVVHTIFGLPMGVWLTTSFMDRVPLEVEESAIVDGCSRLQVLFRIVVPMSWIGIASVGIFHFVGSWSEYGFASILLETQKLRTAPVGLAEYVFLLQAAQFNKIGAAAVIMSIPILVLFLIVQRHFVRGMVAGSVKG